MKLQELDMLELGSGSMRQRPAVAGGNWRIGRDIEEPPDAAGGEQHRRCGDDIDLAVGADQHGASDSPVLHDQPAHPCRLPQLDPSDNAEWRGSARQRARPRSDRHRRAGFAGESARPPGRTEAMPSGARSNSAPISSSSRTRSGPSLTSTSTAARSDSPPDAAMVSAACCDGRIAGGHRDGDAALRPRGARIGKGVLGHQQHVVTVGCEAPRAPQPRDSGPDHQRSTALQRPATPAQSPLSAPWPSAPLRPAPAPPRTDRPRCRSRRP